MGFFESISTCYSKMVQWKGRASRSEYWWFFLYQVLAATVLQVVIGVWLMASMATNPSWQAVLNGKAPSVDEVMALFESLWIGTAVLGVFMFFAFTLPALSVLIRRLHDSGHSGWWYWIALVPIVGIIILFIFTLLPSDQNHNRFGPPPGGQKPILPYGYDAAPVKPRRARKVTAAEAEAALAGGPRDDFKEYYRNVVKPAIDRPKPGT